jgi:cytochrome P450
MQSTFQKCAEATLARLSDAAETGLIVDIHAFLMQLTLDVIGRTAFALDLAAQTPTPSQIAVLLTEFLNTADAPGRIPSKDRRKKLDIVRSILRPVIAGRMADVRGGGTPTPKDLLTLLCAAKDPVSGRQMTEEQVLAEVMTFLFAGHDTTANLMAWFVVAMSDHPAIRAQLLRELDSVFGEGPVDAARVGNCELLECAIKETLRHHAPVPMFARVPARRGVTLSNGKYAIPEGTLTLMAPWIVHHHPLLWKDPDVFDPSRCVSGLGGACAAGEVVRSHFPHGMQIRYVRAW